MVPLDSIKTSPGRCTGPLGRLGGIPDLDTCVVVVKGLSYRRGRHTILHDLDFCVEAGEIVAIMGPNGSGKTTALNLLCGLLRPSAGQVTVCGAKVSMAVRHIGVVPAEPRFYENFDAMANLSFAVAYTGRHMRTAQKRNLLAVVGLDGAKGQLRRFSQGMRRRLALAIALAKEPKLLLLDESTNNLDAQGVQLLQRQLALSANQGVATVFATHCWAEARRLGTRVIHLRQGRIIADDRVVGSADGADHQGGIALWDR